MGRMMAAMAAHAAATCVVALFGPQASAQAPLWDDFDEYDGGDSIELADGDEGWDLWDLAAVTAVVSDEQSYSEPNSLRLAPASDVVQVFTDLTSGQWVARAMTYYPSDSSGDALFILLNTYSHGGGKNWSTQVRFNPQGVTSVGGTGFSRNRTRALITDRWVEIRVEIDLDAGMQAIYYDDQLLDASHQWQANGINEFQCIDLYSDSMDGFYYDDVAVYEKCETEIQASPARGVAPLEVTFDASQSECPDSGLSDHEWEFGDGQAAVGPMVMHTYTDPGLYQARVTMVSEDGVPVAGSVLVGVGCRSGDLAPWSEGEVGAPLAPGCGTLRDGCIEFKTIGSRIDRLEDDLHLIYREVTGDFSAVARIRELDWANLDKVGIMARSSLDPGSAFAFSAAWSRSTGNSGRIERRDAPGDARSGATRTVREPWEPPNLWLRLDREGETFTGYWSLDGQAWDEINNRTVSGAADTMLVGVTAAPDAEGGGVEATFCDVVISQGPSADGDGDGRPDAEDNCPAVANADQSDGDGDGLGDVCDNCPSAANGDQADGDNNGVGDVCESAGFRRGDVDGLGSVQLTDAVGLLDFLFGGAATPPCMEAADTDDDGTVGITDAVRILGYLFSGGAAPAAPGPDECGPDPDGSPASGCEEYTSC